MNSIIQIQPNNITQQVTMSSPELVEFINNHRKEVATVENHILNFVMTTLWQKYLKF
ncbi:hypothetical protein [Acinetobacter schindleri]|uniref:hypothetical protein n=1 Tax=Acinetobacter schindleri TaxID=108981 RepID=UPI0035E3C5EE